MTIETLTSTSGPYTGADSTDTYAYTFRITNQDQLRVVETTDAGVITVLTLTDDYTVTGVGNEAGGNVVRVAGNLPTDYTWYILRAPGLLQETDFPGQGGLLQIGLRE